MSKIRVVSFDLDGTITDASFVDSVWLEGIPRLYAHKNCVTFDEAKKDVKNEYDKVGRQNLDWYDPHHWIKKFGLDTSANDLLKCFENKIKIFPEVPKILEELNDRGLRLIVISNARREFVDLELEKTGIAHHFERIYSSTSDFGLVKKSASIYQKVCDVSNITPEEMVHVGDDHYFDFEVPKKLGIHAFFLDRSKQCKEESAIHSLQELNEKLRDLG